MTSTLHANPKETVVGLLVFLMVICLSSCSTTPRETVIAAPNPNWVKVRSNPPTWYPRGTSANGATSHRDGEWVYTEDPNDTRFFIPHHGLSPDRRKALLAEALAARDPAKIRKISEEETQHLIETGVLNVIAAPFLALGHP